MSGKKGYQATLKLSQRNLTQRGGNAPNDLPAGDPGSLARHAAGYLEFLAVRNYTPDTIEGRRDALKVFLIWSIDRDLTQPAAITKPIRFIQQLLGHEKLEKRRRLVGVLDRSEATCPEGVSSREAAANQTTAIYTRVSIGQLKAVHGKTHPAETGKKS